MPIPKQVSDLENDSQAKIELYAKLAQAEARSANGEESKDFNEVADIMREKLIGKFHGTI